MNIGDKRVETPTMNTTHGDFKSVPVECRVAYIHPERRFYTVEFFFPLTGWRFRESYYVEDRAHGPV